MADAGDWLTRLAWLARRLREPLPPQRVLELLLDGPGGEPLIPGATAVRLAPAGDGGPEEETRAGRPAEGGDGPVEPAIVLPLGEPARPLGTLEIFREGVGDVDDEERHFLDAAAALCAQALERARLQEELAGEIESRTELRREIELEVRNHQNAVEGYLAILELANTGGVSDAEVAYLRNIRRSGAELLESVSSLLYGNAPEMPALRIEDVEVHELVAAAQRAVLPDLKAKRLGFEYRPSAVALTVRADRAQVTRILTRLLANAIRYTQRGSIAVSFSVHDDSVLIQVRDTGCGISASRLRGIFSYTRPARRPHGERRLPGTGLARARAIAQKLGGDLSVHSSEGRGTTFTLLLPKGAPGVQLHPDDGPVVSDA